MSPFDLYLQGWFATTVAVVVDVALFEIRHGLPAWAPISLFAKTAAPTTGNGGIN